MVGTQTVTSHPPSSFHTCTTCGGVVDSLRAPAVAILNNQFVYFCSRDCRKASPAVSIAPPPSQLSAQEEKPITLAPQALVAIEPSSTSLDKTVSLPLPDPAPITLRSMDLTQKNQERLQEDTQVYAYTFARAEATSSKNVEPSVDTSNFDSILFTPFSIFFHSVAGLCGITAIALAVLPTHWNFLRLLLLTCALFVMIGLRMQMLITKTKSNHVLIPLYTRLIFLNPFAFGGTSLIVAINWFLYVTRKPIFVRWFNIHASIVFLFIVASTLCWLNASVILRRSRNILSILYGPQYFTRPKVQFSIHETLPYDLTITEGSCTGDLWKNPSLRQLYQEGDCIPAGTTLIEGQITGNILAGDDERIFGRLLSDLIASSSRFRWHTFYEHRWVLSLFSFVLIVISGILQRNTLQKTLLIVAYMILCICICPVFEWLLQTRWLLAIRLCKQGIAVRDYTSFETLASLRAIIFLARSCLWSPYTRPKVHVESFVPEVSDQEILKLAASLYKKAQHPIAQTITKAAIDQNIAEYISKNIVDEPGFGAQGESQEGEKILVGSRAFCMQEKITTGLYEERILALENTLYEVFLVARNHRLLGCIAVQNSLRTDLSTTISKLHDLEIDPIVLGDQSRTYLEVLAHAIGIEHVRANILPDEQPSEVQKIVHHTSPVAIVGNWADDSFMQQNSTSQIGISLYIHKHKNWDSYSVLSAKPQLNFLAQTFEITYKSQVYSRIMLIMSIPFLMVAALVISLGLAPLSGLILVACMLTLITWIYSQFILFLDKKESP